MSKPSAIDPTLIRALAGVLRDTDLTEIEVEQEGLRVRVARNLQIAAHVAVPAAPAPAAVSSPMAAAPAAQAAPAANAVTSPMVGTAYLKPAPDKPAFIEIGTAVRQGQTILIIEAMKTFNEIPAPRAGVVREILVENGEPVEFGAPLVVIE